MNAAAVLCGCVDQAREEAVRQDAHVLGEEAEEQADQEVRGRVRLRAVLAQELRQPGELPGRLLCHLLGGLRRAQRVRIVKCLAQDRQLLRQQQIIQAQLVDPLDGVSEVRVDDDALKIADDQQRRVEQRLAVLEELLVGLPRSAPGPLYSQPK